MESFIQANGDRGRGLLGDKLPRAGLEPALRLAERGKERLYSKPVCVDVIYASNVVFWPINYRMPKPPAKLGYVLVVVLCLFVVGLGLYRCERRQGDSISSPSADKPAKMAQLTMVNTSSCEWRVVMTAVSGGEPRVWKLALGQTLDLNLAGGDYAIEQTMLMDDAGPDATRRFSMQLEAGQSYRWRLVTLLSGEAGGVAMPAPGKDRHE